MQTANSRIYQVLNEQRATVLERWVQAVTDSSGRRTSKAETERDLAPMLDALAAGARGDSLDPKSAAFDELRAMIGEFSRDRARAGFTPTETSVAVFKLKDAVFGSLDAEPGTYADFLPFSRFIDDLGLLTFEMYAQAREAIIVNQSEQLLELSTPVVKLWDGIVAVPLVGTLDSARTQVVMESLLQTIVATGSEHAIIDITGVAAVDTQVAQHLLKTVVAARLMGAECVISGIRPQIAQTIVDLGIEFGEIKTKATLADALRVTLKAAGLEVRPIERRA